MAPARIEDEFSKLKVSRQRKWQLRKVRSGRCMECGEPIEPGASLCLAHRVSRRERTRKRLGCKRRNKNCESYRAEAAAKTAKAAKAAKTRARKKRV